jgi:hypothetical protein
MDLDDLFDNDHNKQKHNPSWAKVGGIKFGEVSRWLLHN